MRKAFILSAYARVRPIQACNFFLVPEGERRLMKVAEEIQILIFSPV
jgi:hypothetical protein